MSDLSSAAYVWPGEAGGADDWCSRAEPALPAAIGEARRASTETARTAAYVAAEDRALALAPVLPLVQFETHVVVAANVHDLRLAPNGSIDWLAVRAAQISRDVRSSMVRLRPPS